MAKNLKPCNFIVRTGGEALSSVEATAKALEGQVKKLSSVDDFIEPKESEIKNGNTFNLIRGNVYEGKSGVGQSKNIFGATLADALPSLFGDSDKRRINKLEISISEYENELSDSKTNPQRRIFIEGQLEPLRYELNKIRTEKEDFEKTSKENEQLGLVWLTSQKDTAKSYAEQLTDIPDSLRGERPMPSVNYDQVEITPKKIFDLASLTDEVGNVYESGDTKKIKEVLGLDIDNLPEAVQYAYQLFRGKNAKPVVEALINKGYDVVKLNESGQDNFILLNAPHLRDTPQNIASAYHAAKKDGSNPELVKAVEDLLGTSEEKSLSYPEMVEYLASHPELMEEGKAERRKIGGGAKKAIKGQLVLKDGKVITPTSIDGQTIFYHGSTKPRKGRLRANRAEGFGEAVYFGTDKKAVEEDYEEQYTTEAYLNLKKPLYYNSKDWDVVIDKAVELYSRKETPKLLEEYSRVLNGVREWYSEDAQAEYKAKGYLEPPSAENWVKEEDATWINKAAQELGYDAIIAPHHSFGNEIAVLDENAVIYPEEIETGAKMAAKQKVVAVAKEASVENTPEGIAARIRNKKQKGALSAIDFGISVTVYNGALEFMASQVEKGTKLGNAIANTIKWIDEKVKGEKWNKGAFGRYMNDTYKVTLGDGREVEVIRDDSKETAEVINGWYQPIEQKILDSKEESLPAKTWADRLRSKEDEDLWTGVRAFLEEKGTERVSRQELLDFIKDNRIEIVEVVKGEESWKEAYKIRYQEILDGAKELKEYGISLDQIEGKKDLDDDDWDKLPKKIQEKFTELSVLSGFLDEARRNIGNSREVLAGYDKATKFSQYQLEGEKENYKEVLVTLPSKEGKNPLHEKRDELNKKLSSLRVNGEYEEALQVENEISEITKELKRTNSINSTGEKALFKSSHFDEPNILVHLRMNTRTDAEGNKVLFLEEVQSDWGQKGKKEGFEIKEEDVEKEYELADKNLDKLNAKFDKKYGNDFSPDMLTQDEYNEYSMAATKRARLGSQLSSGRFEGVPSAPFVTDTNAWVKLGLKAALKEAVAQGATKIVWTTGEQQIERYDLSKQVRRIEWNKYTEKGAVKLVTITPISGNDIELPIDKDGIVIKNLGTQFDGQRIDNVVGKEIADKVLSENYGDLSGDGLKVGGKGMIGFYGSPSENKEGIVGGIAKSLVKDLTGKEGKIGETKIETDKNTLYESYIYEQPDGQYKIWNGESRKWEYDLTKDAADNRVKKLNEKYIKKITSTQNSIEITPELKASVEAGMPLFGTATPEQKLKQAFKEWRNEQGKMGIVPNWERLAEADIKLLKALGEYIVTKLKKGAYDFNKFLKDIAASGVENIDADRERWRKFYDDTVEKEAPEAPAAPKAEKKAEGEPEGKKPVRELPEGEVEETEKPILGRAFRGTTDEALAEKLAQMGLYRTPANIAEAFELGQQIVSEIGTDEAIKLGTKGEVPNGLVRIGILKAVLEDINKQRDSLPVPDGTKGEERYLDALDQLGDKYAEALAAFSPSLTESGQVLRAWQEVIESAEFEFDYEGRKAKYKTLFGDEAYTKEVDERFKEYDKKIKQAEKEKKELQDKIDRLEAQGIVDNVSAQKKPITSFFKEAAARVRKLKLSRPGIFSSATPASLAWDATIEAVAVVLEASGTLEEAIVAGVKKLKTTDWYKSLTDAKKNDAENELTKYVKDTYILKATVDDGGKIQIPSGLLRSYVTSGVKDANAIIDDILSYLKESNPALTEADVRSAILEVGKKEAPKATEITKSVNTLKTIIKMISQLEQVEQGRRIAKSEGKKKEMDKTIASLKKQIEQKHLEQFGVKPGALTDEQRLANIKKNALQRIADMKAMKPRPEPRERVKWDAEMSKIANEEFRLKEKWNEEFREAERKKMSNTKKFFQGAYLAVNFSKTIMTGIGDLGVLLIQGSMLPFRSASVTKEAIANMGRAFLSQEEYVNQLRKINESELYRVVRKSGLDLPQITSLEIERVEEANIGALGETIFDVLMLPFKYVPKIGPKMYEWAKNHINPARVFNRTQTAYMNTLRYGSFTLSANNLLEKGITYEDNPKAYKDVAAMINTMSGRTRLIGEESAATMKALNLVFYSPKNWASVIKMFTPVIFYHVGRRRADSIGVLGMSEAQQTFIRTYASYVATSAALMFLLKAITTDEEDEDEEKKREEGNVTIDWENPQSSAFNKIRIGNQVFDPWGGKQQIITLQARMIIHFMGGRAFKDPYTGMEKTLEETQRFKHPLGLMYEYGKGKFAPYTSAAVKLLSSQKAKGREWYIRQSSEGEPMFNILDPVSESYTNITYEAVNDLYGHQPLTIAEVMTLFLIAGGGINTLNDQESKTIVSQIREKINPGEDEKRRYAANMASRLKDGDTEGAATVYDEAMGIKGISDKAKIARLRREGANDLYESATKDVVGQRYGVDDKYRKYLLQVVYQNKPVAIPSSMSEKKKQIISAINGLTPEQKEEVRADYDYRYEELMNVAKGIDKLTSQPQKYEKRANREYWVRQYKKATGKK